MQHPVRGKGDGLEDGGFMEEILEREAKGHILKNGKCAIKA